MRLQNIYQIIKIVETKYKNNLFRFAKGFKYVKYRC